MSRWEIFSSVLLIFKSPACFSKNTFFAVNSMDVPGLMGRSVEDLAAYFKVLVGLDPLDSTTIHMDTVQDEAPGGGLRIGVPQEYICDGMSAEVIESLSDVCHTLEEAGCRNGTHS
jgi:aspartyl-tRNA(Asn)/glutamyl-tRNA(Gln) amidotransferase subunit A